jgi:hypothetical protein
MMVCIYTLQYNLGNPAVLLSDTSNNPASGMRQASATLCRFLQAAEADLCSVELDKLNYLDLRQYTVFQFFNIMTVSISHWSVDPVWINGMQ